MSEANETPPIHGSAVAALVELLDAGQLMALGVNRPDGWPQVTTVGYANEGLNLYFVIARDSQKFANLQADPRVSVAIRAVGEEGGVGVSMAGRVSEVTDPAEVERLNQMVFRRYPEAHAFCPGGSSVAVMRLKPEILSPVAVMGGRSHAQTYAVGAGGAPPADPGKGTGVSRLF